MSLGDEIERQASQEREWRLLEAAKEQQQATLNSEGDRLLDLLGEEALDEVTRRGLPQSREISATNKLFGHGLKFHWSSEPVWELEDFVLDEEGRFRSFSTIIRGPREFPLGDVDLRSMAAWTRRTNYLPLGTVGPPLRATTQGQGEYDHSVFHMHEGVLAFGAFHRRADQVVAEGVRALIRRS